MEEGEEVLGANPNPDLRAWALGELDRIEADVRHVEVPASFAESLYHLREHIAFVRAGAGG